MEEKSTLINTNEPTKLYEKLKIEMFWVIMNNSFYDWANTLPGQFFADMNMFFWKDVAVGVGNCRMPSPILMAAIVWMFKLDITQNLFKVNIRKPKKFVGTLILIHLWSRFPS